MYVTIHTYFDFPCNEIAEPGNENSMIVTASAVTHLASKKYSLLHMGLDIGNNLIQATGNIKIFFWETIARLKPILGEKRINGNSCTIIYYSIL